MRTPHIGHVKFLSLLFLATLQCSCAVIVHESSLLLPSRVQLFPDDILATSRTKCKPIEVRVDTGVITRGWYFENPGSKRILFYFYGRDGKLANFFHTFDSMALAYNADVFSMDYRGYGFSDGDAGLRTITSDALIEYDSLQNQLNHDRKPVFVFGRSLGSGPAASIAAGRPVAGLILLSPPTTAAEVVPYGSKALPWYQRMFVHLIADDSLTQLKPQVIDLIRQIKSPLLIIHGSADKIIPPEFGRKLYNECPSEKKRFVLIDGMNHVNISIYTGTLRDSILSFLNSY